MAASESNPSALMPHNAQSLAPEPPSSATTPFDPNVGPNITPLLVSPNPPMSILVSPDQSPSTISVHEPPSLLLSNLSMIRPATDLLQPVAVHHDLTTELPSPPAPSPPFCGPQLSPTGGTGSVDMDLGSSDASATDCTVDAPTVSVAGVCAEDQIPVAAVVPMDIPIADNQGGSAPAIPCQSEAAMDVDHAHSDEAGGGEVGIGNAAEHDPSSSGPMPSNVDPKDPEHSEEDIQMEVEQSALAPLMDDNEAANVMCRLRAAASADLSGSDPVEHSGSRVDLDVEDGLDFVEQKNVLLDDEDNGTAGQDAADLGHPRNDKATRMLLFLQCNRLGVWKNKGREVGGIARSHGYNGEYLNGVPVGYNEWVQKYEGQCFGTAWAGNVRSFEVTFPTFSGNFQSFTHSISYLSILEHLW